MILYRTRRGSEGWSGGKVPLWDTDTTPNQEQSYNDFS